MGLIIRHTQQPTTELAELEHRKYSGIMFDHSSAFIFHLIVFHPCRLSGHTFKYGSVRSHP